MKRTTLLAGVMFTMSGAGAEPASVPDPKTAAPLRARLTNELIREAVRATVRERDDASAGPAPSGTVLSGGAFRSFARDVAASKKPSCFGQDALTFQPAKKDTKDWHFEAKELMAAPFWAAAILRGKCN